jgi:two-component system sensor histidine kinase KdpD
LWSGLPPRRRVVGLAAALALLVVATVVLTAARRHVGLTTDVSIYLLVVVVVSVVGGFWAALPAAIAAFLVLNFYFAPPLHTLAIADNSDVIALLVFLVVAVVVSSVVDLSAQRLVRVGRASETEQARTALLNAVSHDLRTPLASAKAAVSGLLASDVTWNDSDRTELLKNADDALDRLTDLVTNLLDLSRLQAGALPVLAEPTSLDGVVERAVDHIAPRDAPVELDVAADLPEVLADAGLLERVVANLVQNALRYAPAGTGVRIQARVHDDAVELLVVDHGPGIRRADSEAVFQPFQRRDDAHSGDGVGLGLAIARGFAQAMNGDVHAEQTPGGGTTMVVRLMREQR